MDITKCLNEERKIKEKCLRYLSMASKGYQSYAYFKCDKDNGWEYLLRCNVVKGVS